MAGLKHFSLPAVQRILGNPALRNKVVRIGRVEEEDLPAVYNLAGLFIFPSIWEGFGLPPLEAMACGTPVITSDRSSLPEVVGEAGVLVDPENIAQMALEIHRVLTDTALKEGMIRKGIEQARKFNWEEKAKKTLEILERVPMFGGQNRVKINGAFSGAVAESRQL